MNKRKGEDDGNEKKMNTEWWKEEDEKKSKWNNENLWDSCCMTNN